MGNEQSTYRNVTFSSQPQLLHNQLDRFRSGRCVRPVVAREPRGVPRPTRRLTRQSKAPIDCRRAALPVSLIVAPHKALRVYEDFSALLGALSWNPARKVAPREISNPARDVLGLFGIHDFDQLITDEQLAALELAMRQAIGGDIPLTQEEVFDAITNADAPIRRLVSGPPRASIFT